MGDLKLTGVTKDFGIARVIHPTDLQIRDGEFTVFVGPSGCGKSTMLRMIAGLEDISAGTLEIDGRVVNDLAPAKRGIAMVFQSYALYPHLNVYENIAFPLRVDRRSEAEVRQKVGAAAEVLKLTERLQHKPGELSGGQRQRVAIGRAIVREPSVFLFDEPLSNLDAALRGEMRVELSRLHGKLANTMIYVTHDQIEAMTMADRIVVLNAGRVEQVGSPLELFHRPANRFVAGFIGNPNMNFLPSRVITTTAEGITLQIENGPEFTIPVEGKPAPGDPLTLGIRPDDLRPDPAGLQCRVDVVERLGNSSVLYCVAEGERQICMVTDGATQAVPDEMIGISFDPAAAHVFTEDGRALPRRHVPVDLARLPSTRKV
ncbi:sn-glycerol-3-phosphate ABC transporter ATP-binding protein UgpC [Paracoccus sp. MBLB3053]|uniref:Sn-glycerol-3-phosphate ABC transporter ATP-binding protein UgpC n=1 Tax=Paracoccus aurantius TaxID=3073814 RepID=A0ABU2HXV2_9RHOB|nr:sn-glycerol-3-phosphate ABC transporter ATP-binding protein UgpC [Paracoccus sp. MBLB3053]MDS9469129.1 sn-glycerol-3-phosphate ABC transporter ATP-binding protein UgpC [Paracoccus sp. MBLB3053]